MTAITDLDTLLRSMSPQLIECSYVFCSVPGRLADYLVLDPIAIFRETEGLTLVLEHTQAVAAGFAFEGRFRLITLTVHSSLAAVGLTAAVASKLATHGISANVIAAYYHDHIFVQDDKAELAMAVLAEFDR